MINIVIGRETVWCLPCWPLLPYVLAEGRHLELNSDNQLAQTPVTSGRISWFQPQ